MVHENHAGNHDHQNTPLEPARVTLDGTPLTVGSLDALLDRPIDVTLTDAVWKQIERSAADVRRIAMGDAAAYGINTGFGSLCTKRIRPADVERLQLNLIESHAVGVGPPAPPEVVRCMMLLKIHALTHGVSGVSRKTIECLIRLLAADALPIVPTQGSLGASGDLAPLAHMVLPMIGRGAVTIEGRTVPTAQALPRLGIEATTLGPKEGLGLINGTQFMLGYATVICARAQHLAKHADVTAAMSLEGIRGSVKPFDRRLHALRPHRGAIETADNMRRVMRESQIVPSHAECGRVQDPYSFRCVPTVHGATRDALRHVVDVVETEMNSVTDNPLILDNLEVISGGLFHGQPLALVMDYLAIALAELASISERRIYLLLSGVDGLPQLLMQDTGLNSGFMMPQYTAAALVSENKGLATPASVDSIPTSLGQEDHVSMGARGAVKCLQVLDNTETVLAIEQMCAAQALDYRAPLRPGVGPRIAHGVIRERIAHTETDRLFGDDIQASLTLLRSRTIVTAVEAETGTLT